MSKVSHSAKKHGRNRLIVKLFQKQKGKCYLCGGDMKLATGHRNTATVDHVIPKSKLAGNLGEKAGNKKAACARCNHDKGDTLPWEMSRPGQSGGALQTKKFS